MKTYVALLRGINVGGNSKVSMAELKKVFEKCEYENVSTYINSGNVIFDAPSGKQDDFAHMESKLEKAFGFKIALIVRDAANIQRLAKTIPEGWTNDTDQKTDVIFLWDKYDSKKSISLLKLAPKIDTVKYIKGALVWNIKRSDYNKSGMHKFIGTELYKNMTARNVNTVRKLAALTEARKKIA